VKAPPFAYARAESLDDALALLGEAGDDAKLLAGGQSLMPLLAYRVARPSHLVDIDGLDELAGIERTPGGLRVGALTRHVELAHARLDGAEKLLAAAAGEVGHVPIRVRGTLGGSIAHADPAAELPLALVTLEATLHVRSTAGERAIPAGELFLGPFTTTLGPDEAVVAATIPDAARVGHSAFAEFAVRTGDFALAAVAVALDLDLDAGVARHVRIGLGAVDATPVRAARAEALLEGAELSGEAVESAAATAAIECDPAEDPTTSAAYRRTLVASLVRACLTRLRLEAVA
jgi:carbon-monoxide dehydrogenase medium subunit/6-hydroxypseudooxynicotine dehydrogenase subunit alpha